MKSLILTEKPSVARDFYLALHSGTNQPKPDGYFETNRYIITWAIGHLLAPLDPEDYDIKFKTWKIENLPILPKEFKYKPHTKTKRQLEIIKKLLKRTDIDSLIVATDAGREGELIARLILNASQVRVMGYRFFTSAALTKEVIESELKNMKPLADYDRLYIAGRARQYADWIIGMNLSRLATLKFNDLFSVGRVQTAVLSMLVERRKTIEQFIPVDYFELKAKFLFKNGIVEAYWYDKAKKEEEKRKEHSFDFDKIKDRILNQESTILQLEESKKTQYPLGLFSLTELQREANVKYGFSASKTLEVAQTLYEKYKVLSYPRTDSKHMASSSFDLIKSLVYKFKEAYPAYFEKFAPYKVSLKNKSIFDDSKLTDHHGLVPLKKFTGAPDSFEGKIYQLVLKRFISNFLENHVYLETEIIIGCENEVFKTKGKKILEVGFRALDSLEKETNLPALSRGEGGKCTGADIESRQTKPPSEYTEASLLYDMTNPSRLVTESDYKKIFRTEVGLGTQATRAQIIETLISRDYVKRMGKSLVATGKGSFLIENLNLLPSTKILTDVSQTAKLEIELQRMAEGEVDDTQFKDSIANRVQTATEEWKKISQKFNSEAPKKNESSKIIMKKDLKMICPQCSSSVLNFPKSYSCSKWKEGCKFVIWKIIAQKKLSLTIVESLITKRKTPLIKGFKSKKGKSFSAFLLLNKDGQVEFSFNPPQK